MRIEKYIKIKLDEERLTGEQITKLAELHTSNIQRLKKLNDYYLNENEINNRTMEDPLKPNNKITHAFGKYVTDMATGYFMGKGVRYIVEEDEFAEIFNNILDEEYEKDNLYELAKESSIKGIAYEMLYIDENSELHSKHLSSEEVIPIFSNRVNEFLSGAVRLYCVEDYFNSDNVIRYAEHYTSEEIITFTKTKNEKHYKEISREYHMLGDVPFILYLNNKELKGDFENIISLIDAYDKAQSDTANDFEYFTDAYLVLTGAGGMLFFEDKNSEEYKVFKALREQRIIDLPSESKAEWLIKKINDTAVENYKNRIFKDIFFLSQVPALTDESFSINSSGVAISYKLIGLENLAMTKENKFRASIKKKLKIITEFINLKHNKNFNADDIQIKFDRNTVKNLSEIIDNAVKLEGIVSKETLLELLPFIKDVKSELDRLSEEFKAGESLNKVNEDDYYGE